jgi:CMP-N-acetylneuraminic acid synthetase
MRKLKKRLIESRKLPSQFGPQGDRTACFIPIKKNSKRIKDKNFQFIDGKKLYEITLEKAIYLKSKGLFEEVFVDTDSKEIADYCLSKNICHIPREDFLKSDQANGNHLLESWIQKFPEYDIYAQLHVTAPFLELASIEDCIAKVKDTALWDYDSSLTAVEEYSWYWFNKKPINYLPEVLPRSQDASPLIRESTALYVIKKDTFRQKKCRIGYNPYFCLTKDYEAIDLDNPIDLKIAKTISKELIHED